MLTARAADGRRAKKREWTPDPLGHRVSSFASILEVRPVGRGKCTFAAVAGSRSMAPG